MDHESGTGTEPGEDASSALQGDATVENNDVFEGVHPLLRDALAQRGFDGLTDVQSAILAADREGRDLQVSSQTGSGKTVGLGFVLVEAAAHAAARSGHTGPSVGALVITPTRELAQQVSDELAWLYEGIDGVQLASVTGGTPIFRDRRTLAQRPDVLVGTPGRLLDHIRNGNLDLSEVREVVLDEADQMLDMGFREDLEAILDETCKDRRIHLVSATFPDGIQHLARRYQNDPLFVEGTPHGDANADIEHIGHLVRGNERYAALVNHLLLADGDRTLVFVERRADTTELSNQLEADGFAALPISGDLAQAQRERALGAFKDGRVSILVATDVAARGLDVPDVQLVVQTSPPIDPETYTHRSGRTGRAGNKGRSLLFSPPQRRRFVDRLLNDAGVSIEWREVPSADEVSEHVANKAREESRERIAKALAKDPGDVRRAFAKELLDEHDPETLVAALVRGFEPERRARAQDVGAPAQRSVAETGHSGGVVRFFISYGENQGANPSRVLAAVCRRGQVDGTQIGSIAVHPNATTFDVEASVAEAFERNAGQRDPRDPNVVIRRDRGPVARRRGGIRRGGPRRRGYGARRRRSRR